ncbi:MAG: hypothetical protein QXI42_00460 [Thermoproteota archaeon]|nr:hypothetical protein [Candidatus Brockarchaeota archaeon]
MGTKSFKHIIKPQSVIIIMLLISTSLIGILALGPPPYPSASWSYASGGNGAYASGAEASADRTTGSVYTWTICGVSGLGNAWAYADSCMIDYYSVGSSKSLSNESLYSVMLNVYNNRKLEILNKILTKLDSIYETTKDQSIRDEIKKSKEFFRKSVSEAKIIPQIDIGEKNLKGSVLSSGTKVVYATLYVDLLINEAIYSFKFGSIIHEVTIYLTVYDATTGGVVTGDSEYFSSPGGFRGYITLSAPWYAQSGHQYVILVGAYSHCSMSGGFIANAGASTSRSTRVTYISVSP